MPIYVPGKLNLAKGFTPESYMYEFPSQYPVWSPANITTALWLDAADASTVTTVTGAVSQWNDKSGNGRNATQSAAGSRPALISNVYTGKSAIRSDGIDDFLSITPFTVSAGIRAYGVINPISPSPDKRNGDWVWMTDFIAFSPHFSGTTAAANNWFSSFFSTSRPQITATSIPANTLYLTFIEQTGTQLKGRVFGTVAESTVAATFNGTPTTSFQLFSTVAATVARFDICEVVFIQSPSTDQQQKTEGYLAHKWGLTANLPNDHPYKTVGPTP
jgi:hypothetical protein